MKAGGVDSMARVTSGANRPKPIASTPTSTPAVYCLSRSPLDEMMALTGPVRQVGTAPTNAPAMVAAPQPTAILSTGGAWPAAVSTAKPWPFCTTSTVIASGTTSSTIAPHEKSGRWNCGAASICTWARSCVSSPIWCMTAAPVTSATISGGSHLASFGTALTTRKAAVMAAAIARSLAKACTQSRPNCRNTPATMPMTIGIGIARIARCTQPSAPSAIISAPVAR